MPQEAKMYQTLILQLIREFPEIHYRLKAQRALLAKVETLALELKTRHQVWKDEIARTKPEMGEAQVTSAALEIAIHEQERLFAAESPPDDSPLNLDQAMAFLRDHIPVA
jgi:hypothetical protein